MRNERYLKVGFSADFLDEQRRLIFPDIGLSLLDSEPNIAYEFLTEYDPEYTSEQLAGYDVPITMKPRITADSLRGVERLCAIGRCGCRMSEQLTPPPLILKALQ
jgi:D-3-phosphoglycerate dehydrogenase